MRRHNQIEPRSSRTRRLLPPGATVVTSPAKALHSPPALRLLPSVTARELTDQQLVEAVVSGDQRIARELYLRLHAVVDRTLYRVFGRREEGHEDLVQSAFEQIVLTLHRGSYVGACNLKTWAASIATHVGFNALRSRRRERGVVDRGAPIEASFRCTEGERLASARIELGQIRAQLSAMKPEQAETVFLHDVLGHLLAEIAVMMDVSVAAATSRLVRGRRELYRRLEVTPAS